MYVYLWNVYIRSRIEPSNAFRVVFKVAKYTADVKYGGLVEMTEKEHELWLYRSIGYSLALFMMMWLQRLSGDLARHC